jgi:threonine dehydrogenase-like Zn-dependent dehydrogenase
MTDLLTERLQAAARCGADWTGNARENDIAAAILSREPRGLDAVFECSGDPTIIDFGLRLLTPGGTLLMVGIPPAERASFDIHHARRRELTLKSVRRQKGCTEAVIEMIESGQIDPRAMLTHHFPLEKIAEAFGLVEGYRDGVIKAIIEI